MRGLGRLGRSPAGRGEPLSGRTGLPGLLHGSAEPAREWAALGGCGRSAEASGLRACQGLSCCSAAPGKRPPRSHGRRLWGAQPAASGPPGAAGARTKGCSVAVSDGRPFVGAANLLAATSRLHSALPMGAQCHAGPEWTLPPRGPHSGRWEPLGTLSAASVDAERQRGGPVLISLEGLTGPCFHPGVGVRPDKPRPAPIGWPRGPGLRLRGTSCPACNCPVTLRLFQSEKLTYKEKHS